jgi:transposase
MEEEVAGDGDASAGADVVAGSRVYRGGQRSRVDAPVAGRGLDRCRECIAELGRGAGHRTDEAVVVILVPRSVRVYFATQPTNLRMSFEGLSNAVREVLRQDPLGGHIFVFLNRRKNMVKLLVYTRGGYTIVMKRLEAGTFTFPAGVVEGVASVAIDVHELAMLLEGIDIRSARTSARWEPPMHARPA